MAEKRDQNDEWDGHAEEQKQNRPHGKSPLSRITRVKARPLHNYDVISLPTPNGRGETRAKRAHQQRKEYPQQCMRDRLAGRICRLLSPRKTSDTRFSASVWLERVRAPLLAWLDSSCLRGGIVIALARCRALIRRGSQRLGWTRAIGRQDQRLCWRHDRQRRRTRHQRRSR